MDKIVNNVPVPYEPKKTNRFFIKFPEYFNLSEWVCHSASRPTLRYIGEENGEKKYTWDNLIVKMYDPIVMSTTKSLMDLVNKNKLSDKFDLTIEMLDPIGSVIEKWLLSDCEILSIDFGILSYNIDKPVLNTLFIKINKAELLF
mgnify:CR=1 FL=1